jgi:hypothetical protein
MGKAEWEEAVYESNGLDLKVGNEEWCGTCHDDASAVGDGPAEIYGVSAPNVMGDGVTYGFRVSGHGRPSIYLGNYTCTTCHDLGKDIGGDTRVSTHIDGEQRTYDASSSPTSNYQAGYRLVRDMRIPLPTYYDPLLPDSSWFNLCFGCHLYSNTFDVGLQTNFRNGTIPANQEHRRHMTVTASQISWDSDWDYGEVGSDEHDSVMSCPACHNVHGSPMDLDPGVGTNLQPNPVMIRHGELIGHVPALDFRWYRADGTTPTNLLSQSRDGTMIGGGTYTAPEPEANYVCIGCHGGELRYTRVVNAPDESVTVNFIRTKDLSNNNKNVFAPNEDIQFVANFEITGSGTYFMRTHSSKAHNTTGEGWERKLLKIESLPPGTHKWKWFKKIPGTATPGSQAEVIIKVRMFDQDPALGGVMIDESLVTKTFSIAAP